MAKFYMEHSVTLYHMDVFEADSLEEAREMRDHLTYEWNLHLDDQFVGRKVGLEDMQTASMSDFGEVDWEYDGPVIGKHEFVDKYTDLDIWASRLFSAHGRDVMAGIRERLRGFVDRRRRLAVQRRCEHDWATVWQEDYERHVLGMEPSPFRALNYRHTKCICRKCGLVEDGPSLPVDEMLWADHYLISHFRDE